MPGIGAVLVPVNYRLSVSEFAYILNHSGARMVCAHSDYVAAIESIRTQIPGVEFFVALDGPAPDGWIDYEASIASASADMVPAEVTEDDLLTINYTSGTTANPKGVMITHRNA